MLFDRARCCRVQKFGDTMPELRQQKIVPEIGLHEGIPFEVYSQWDAVNNSVLKIFSDNHKCPAHAKEYLDNGRKDTPALKIGRAIDCYLLEPGRWFDSYAVLPEMDRRTKEGKAAFAEFEASLTNNQEIISQSDFEKITAIYQAVSKSRALRLIQGGKSQICAVWQDKETGLLCKARYDYYQEDIPMITDVKSTSDASPDGFAYDLYKYGYYQQAGFYAMGHEVLTGFPACFVIFAVEKEPPYVHGAYDIGMSTIEAGQNAARAALRKYKICVETGQWPLFSDKITMLDMPRHLLEKSGVNPYQG